MHRAVHRIAMNAVARGLRSWRSTVREMDRIEELRQVASAHIVSETYHSLISWQHNHKTHNRFHGNLGFLSSFFCFFR